MKHSLKDAKYTNHPKVTNDHPKKVISASDSGEMTKLTFKIPKESAKTENGQKEIK